MRASLDRKPKKLPTVHAQDEVIQILNAVEHARDRMLITTASACGLRISEVARLRVEDVDSARMLIHVRQGNSPTLAMPPRPTAQHTPFASPLIVAASESVSVLPLARNNTDDVEAAIRPAA